MRYFFPTFVGNTFVFEPDEKLGVIPFLKLVSALSGILTWVDLANDLALSYKSFHVQLDLKRELCLLKFGTNDGLYVWLLKYNDSFDLPLLSKSLEYPSISFFEELETLC